MNERHSMKTKRKEWQEVWRVGCNGLELHDVIADQDEKDPTGWVFYAKTSWDVLWIRIPATRDRLARVQVEEVEHEARAGHASRISPRSAWWRQLAGPEHDRKGRCGWAGCRVIAPKQRGSTGSAPVRFDRRAGHSSPLRHVVRVIEDLIENKATGQPEAAPGEPGERGSASHEEESQPPSQCRRGFPRRLLFVTN